MTLYALGIFGLIVAVGALLIVKIGEYHHHKKA